MADNRIQYTEELVGAGHPVKADTINRLALVEHNNDGTHKADNVYTDLITKYPRVDVRSFGAKGDGVTDDTAAIQSAINYCLTDARRPLPLYFPKGKYIVSSDLVINARASAVSANWGQFIVYGDGGGSYSDPEAGATIKRSTPGTILRVCEEATGGYPGGGAGVVTQPLNFMRRVHVSHMNFMGDAANPTGISGITGRGVFHSSFYHCGFYSLNYGIRLGKAEAQSQETSADGYELDYCEQNTIERCAFKNVQTHIHILAGDTTTIKDNFFSLCPANAGRIFYFSGGNDFYKIIGNIFHAGVNGAPTTPLTKAIQLYFIRGIDFQDNHFEYANGTLLFGSAELINFSSNMVGGSVQSTANIFNIAFTNSNGRLIIEKNVIGMPQPSVSFINATVIGDDGSYTKLKTCRLRYSGRNKVTTALGGATTWELGSNAEGSGWGEGRFTDAVIISGPTDTYIWHCAANNKLRVKYGSAPSSDTDGVFLGEDAYVSGTIAFPGVTVNAGQTVKVDINASGKSMDLSRFIQLAPDIELGLDDGTAYLNWSYHYFNNGTPYLRIVFHNPTVNNITIGAGTWKYRVMLN